MNDAPVIGADRHPVFVTTPGGWRMEECRAIVTLPGGGEPGRLFVWRSVPDPDLDVAWHREGSVFGPNSQPWAVYTDDGVFTIESGVGCGCSSPLKTMVLPFGSYRMGVLR